MPRRPLPLAKTSSNFSPTFSTSSQSKRSPEEPQVRGSHGPRINSAISGSCEFRCCPHVREPVIGRAFARPVGFMRATGRGQEVPVRALISLLGLDPFAQILVSLGCSAAPTGCISCHIDWIFCSIGYSVPPRKIQQSGRTECFIDLISSGRLWVCLP